MATATSVGSLLVGAATLVGGVFVGKLAVDAASGPLDARSDDDFADAVRLVASLAGLTVTVTQLPAAYEQIKKYVSAAATVPLAPAPAPPAFVPGIPQ